MRDQLASAAMVALIVVRPKASARALAKSAYDIAEEMLAEGIRRQTLPSPPPQKRKPEREEPSCYEPGERHPERREVELLSPTSYPKVEVTFKQVDFNKDWRNAESEGDNG